MTVINGENIYDEWRFYDVVEKMLIRSQEYEKAMETTCALMTKIKDGRKVNGPIITTS